MIAALDIMKVPLVNSAVIAATTFIEGITDVLQVLILLATLVWTIVKIANALKEFFVCTAIGLRKSIGASGRSWS